MPKIFFYAKQKFFSSNDECHFKVSGSCILGSFKYKELCSVRFHQTHWSITRSFFILVCFFSVMTSAFFTILYSMEWGKDKSNEWLVTFLLSFFQSVIVVQPVKVFQPLFLRKCNILRIQV